jgi:lysophospholipase L1-like esterase
MTSETDLVLSPRTGSQISIAESLRPAFLICWIGSNDVLGAITEFDNFSPSSIASQITPVSVFTSNYAQISSRLGALGSKVVFANIPDVSEAAFLMTPQDLTAFLGSSYGLPQGSYTTIVAMLLIKLGLANGSLLQNPSWVLNPSEVQIIEQATNTFNQIIATDAAKVHAPVVDMNSLSRAYVQNPPTVGPVTLTRRYLGGLFSLDGVHGSDTGYALVANQFIQTMNSYYHLRIPVISPQQLVSILYADPFIDFNHNLKVRGRPGVGLLETLGPYLGISGDLQDALRTPGVDKESGKRFMRQYLIWRGRDPNVQWDEKDAIAAFHDLFRFPKR